MPRKQPDLHRADELLDELLADCPSPEAILGESGLLKGTSINCLIAKILGLKPLPFR
jgi:hypothetical protein